MAEKEKKNVYQKLMQARIDFAKKNIQPSGYNAHLNFDYLELKDIIPVANKVMHDNGIMLMVTFNSTECIGRVIDIDDGDNLIEFYIPYPDPTKDAERLKLNAVAMTGAQVTYLRRYMYMLVLDITINDEVDADGEETPVVKPTVKSTPKKSEPKAEKPAVKGKVVVSSEKKSPATPEKRAEIKKKLTNADGQATDLQVQTLKAIMMRWVNVCPSDKEKATELLVRTNGFATCSNKEADELIDMINGKIAEGEGAKK